MRALIAFERFELLQPSLGETFRVLKEKEIRQYGEYRTRRLVLEVWKNLSSGGATVYPENPFSPGGQL